jgi:dimethylhistidine N-methyltransferase
MVRRLDEGDADHEREEVVQALLGRPARIAPRYFYDELGCALYGAICELPEYYPTRTERDIFVRNRAAIAQAIGPVRQFVDIGAGDCCKAEAWLAFLECRRYVAVDIAEPQIRRALTRLSADFPDIEMVGVVTDFSRELVLGAEVAAEPTLFFYPGSSIGNFTPREAVGFLRSIHSACAQRPGSSLLIGVDAKKDSRRLDAAYDDALGVTAAFNRNALLHLNRRFGFDFPLDGFEHVGFYNQAEGRIEMHLQARRALEVTLGRERRRFEAGERIHTENSYKYARGEFEALLREAGFDALRDWSAPDDAFHVFLAA